MIALQLFWLTLKEWLLPSPENLDSYTSSTHFLRHSWQTPLTTLLLNLDLTLQEAKNRSAYLKRAKSAATHLASFLFQNTSEPFAPLSEVKEVVSFYSLPQRQQYISVYATIDNSVMIDGNVTYFREVISCLIANGFDAYRLSDSKIISVNIWVSHRHLHISCTDYGRGMSWWQQKFATTRGYTSKKKHSGHGLWFAKKAVEETFKGQLMIASQLGVGTVVKLVFPLR